MVDYQEIMKKKREACKRFIKELAETKRMTKRYFEGNELVVEDVPMQENVKLILLEALNSFMLDDNTSLPIPGTDISEEALERRDEYSTGCFSLFYSDTNDKVFVSDPTIFIDRDVLLSDVGEILYRISLVCEKDMTLKGQ